jgi:hypothetical protein
MMANFAIDETLEGLTNIESLAVPLPEPKSTYQPYSRLVIKGNGAAQGVGAPVASWTFALLSITEYNQLRTFCPGASAEIYIHTKKDDDTFADFSCTMIVPNDPQDRWYAVRKNYTVTFRNLVLIPEGS